MASIFLKEILLQNGILHFEFRLIVRNCVGNAT